MFVLRLHTTVIVVVGGGSFRWVDDESTPKGDGKGFIMFHLVRGACGAHFHEGVNCAPVFNLAEILVL